MLISIIIPTYNSEKHIEECIIKLMNQIANKENIEVIVVDNGSKDNTLNKLTKYDIKYTIIEKANVSRLRNIGYKLSSGEIIGFVDSDVFVSECWISMALKLLLDDKSIGIVGSYYGLSSNPTWVEKLWVDLKKDIDGEVLFLPAGNMVMRRSVFADVGGFNENMKSGEDYELCQRIRKMNLKIISSQHIKVSHMGNVRCLLNIIKKERWYGHGMLGTMKNESMSKPFVATVLFILINIISIAIIILNVKLLPVLLLAQIMYIILISIYFTRNIKSQIMLKTIKFIPIAYCYLLGRSLSIYDIMKTRATL